MPTISPQTTPYYGGGQVVNPANVISTSGAPSNKAIHNGLGTLAVDNANAAIYGLVSLVGGVAVWTPMGGGSLVVSTLTGDSGGAISPSSGNINLRGTANQISTVGSGSTITWSIPSAFIAPGSIVATTTVASTTTMTAGTGFTVTTGNATLTLGNMIINGAAKQLQCHGGAVTDFIGTATLVNGVATVSNTNIAAGDRIICARSAKNASTAYGTFEVVKTPATNFVITACKSDTTTETGDQSTVEYFIVRQV